MSAVYSLALLCCVAAVVTSGNSWLMGRGGGGRGSYQPSRGGPSRTWNNVLKRKGMMNRGRDNDDDGDRSGRRSGPAKPQWFRPGPPKRLGQRPGPPKRFGFGQRPRPLGRPKFGNKPGLIFRRLSSSQSQLPSRGRTPGSSRSGGIVSLLRLRRLLNAAKARAGAAGGGSRGRLVPRRRGQPAPPQKTPRARPFVRRGTSPRQSKFSIRERKEKWDSKIGKMKMLLRQFMRKNNYRSSLGSTQSYGDKDDDMMEKIMMRLIKMVAGEDDNVHDGDDDARNGDREEPSRGSPRERGGTGSRGGYGGDDDDEDENSRGSGRMGPRRSGSSERPRWGQRVDNDDDDDENEWSRSPTTMRRQDDDDDDDDNDMTFGMHRRRMEIRKGQLDGKMKKEIKKMLRKLFGKGSSRYSDNGNNNKEDDDKDQNDEDSDDSKMLEKILNQLVEMIKDEEDDGEEGEGTEEML